MPDFGQTGTPGGANFVRRDTPGMGKEGQQAAAGRPQPVYLLAYINWLDKKTIPYQKYEINTDR